MADSIEQFSFQLTAGALAEQERALAGLRTGAGIVLAAASIAGSFVGATVSHGTLGLWGVAAMISFALKSIAARSLNCPAGWSRVVSYSHSRLSCGPSA